MGESQLLTYKRTEVARWTQGPPPSDCPASLATGGALEELRSRWSQALTLPRRSDPQVLCDTGGSIPQVLCKQCGWTRGPDVCLWGKS